MSALLPEGSAAGPVDVLVTGSAGFIGAAVVARLQAQGATVQGVDLRAGDAPTVRMDVTDGARVLDVFKRYRPRRVVHAAALVDDRGETDAYQRVNVGGTQNLLDAAAAVGVERFVQVSSIAALGFDPGLGADERTPLCFDTGAPYFDTKAASERLVRQAHADGRLSVVVVRPGDVYGPGSDPWVERPLRMMRRHLPVLVDGGQGLIAHAWIDNVVDGIVAALSVPEAAGGIFQLTDGVHDTTLRAFFERLAAAAGLRLSRVPIPGTVALGLGHAFEAAERVTGAPMPWTTGAIRYLCRRATYSLEASRRVLGYAPAVDLDEGFARLARVLRARGPTTA